MTQLALVVDDARKRGWLENQLVKASHYVLLSCDVEHLQRVHSELEEKPEIWLILLPAHRMEQALDYIGTVSVAPTIVLDEWPDDNVALMRWQVQLMRKLGTALAPERGAKRGSELKQVWLLGASLGGPEAVTTFLAALPADVPVAFVYVQHIEEAFDKALVTHLNRNTHFQASMFQGEARLEPGQVLIVAPEVRPRFLPFGRVIAAKKMWQGQYRPCIDDVAQDLALQYREKLGMIIFTGTCNDGEQAARDICHYGGQVWAQSPDECVSATMPEAAMATGLVEVSGTVAKLAETLAFECRDR
ncbi:MAG TPA: hypothetical protein DIW43_17000 [Spongiibacteraceae bacterium]|nr:hypothetical protein [Spongiibacteraceae bacterium]HCS29159.1 hypothetical protein [Spongiibacteraceae bacterium]|tara:strand:+ start:313 stop:1221 length:909 start_codon:yes stop_codon:yes gene_type:complete